MELRILYVGSLGTGQTSKYRLIALQKLGHDVDAIEKEKAYHWWMRIGNKFVGRQGVTEWVLRNEILKKLRKKAYDLLWIDKGIEFGATSLKKIKAKCKTTQVVHYNPDDPFGGYSGYWKKHVEAIPFFDVHFLSRKENIEEYRARGAKNTFLFDRSYASELHRPLELKPDEQAEFGCEVGFIGSYEEERASYIAFLIENGIKVCVRGPGWQKQKYWNIIQPHYKGGGIMGGGYAKVINGMEIALHFLRKANRDEQDSRTFEIPACGTFMLAERSQKHEELFIDGKEAVFFSDKNALLEKVRYYLINPTERKEIADAGRQRCLRSGYDHESRMRELLEKVMSV